MAQSLRPSRSIRYLQGRSSPLHICRSCRLRSASRIPSNASFSSSITVKENGQSSATTWEGMEWIATKDWLHEFNQPKLRVKPFAPRRVVEADVRDGYLKSLVEVFVFKQENVPLQNLDQISADFPWPEGVHIRLAKGDDTPSITFDSPAAETYMKSALGIAPLAEEAVETPVETPVEAPVEGVVQSSAADQSLKSILDTTATNSETDNIEEKRGSRQEEEQAEEEVQNYPVEFESSWKHIPLSDMDLRFAVMKRALRRTGFRIPDAHIAVSKTAHILYTKLRGDMKPKKLAEIIQHEGQLDPIPNVRFTPNRFSRIDQDKSEGRWKVIEAALRKRGLPTPSKRSQ